MKNLLKFFKKSLTYGYKYGKIVGLIWLLAGIIIAPILFAIGGWKLLLAYLICKLSGVCPI